MKTALARLVFGILLSVWATNSFSTRIKDIVNIRGFRANQLIGYGLVVGLAGTGDTSASVVSMRSASSLLKRLGIQTSPQELVAGSYAQVVATSELPPFAKNGDKLDIRLSTLGDATSLAGGTLLLTPLYAADQNLYVMAQGPVVVGGASGVGKEVLTVAMVQGGGVVEREFIPSLTNGDAIVLSLKKPDFLTNYRVAKQVNQYFKGFYAKSINPSTISVKIPPLYKNDLVAFIAALEILDVEVDRKAVIVMNEKTGTIVMGQSVTIDPVTISHGELSITIKEDENSNDKKNAAEHAIVAIKGVTVGELIDALNQLGVKPKDLVDILRTMHVAGALHAELELL